MRNTHTRRQSVEVAQLLQADILQATEEVTVVKEYGAPFLPEHLFLPLSEAFAYGFKSVIRLFFFLIKSFTCGR